VGIIKSATIRFMLMGNFRLTGADHSKKKRKEVQGEGIVMPGGSYEAEVKEGMIRITEGNRTICTGGSLWMEPVDPGLDRFLLHEVIIGVGFHWEQKEDQEFLGTLKLMVIDNQVQVVNIIPLEEYLVSVISSEMSGDSSPELLKAHTIISRSWLLAQVEKQKHLVEAKRGYETIQRKEGEYTRWYDREDHADFHVCADDHCQRYQGITRAYNPQVKQAVKETGGLVLAYGGSICDARFSKCCGGVTETFESCWEPVSHPYLRRVDDNPASSPVNVDDLTVESNAIRFIRDQPEAFCNTSDPRLLRQVLNDYDRESPDFYRWEVRYSQKELSTLIRERSGIDFGSILDLVPVERGVSSRLIRLRIVGEKQRMVIGKELEIRRLLSKSHLYSSAFIVEKGQLTDRIPGSFTLRGAGWGHGVGLCQIGAAVMADRGYSCPEILDHYFVGSKLEKRYE
jgi:SpoIID/LytB domain protein